MLLTALRQIGEAIAETEFEEPYDRYYTPSDLTGVEHVIAIRLEKTDDGFQYVGTQLMEPDDPVAMAHKHAFSGAHKKDKGLPQRIPSKPGNNINYVLDWPQRDDIGEAADAAIVEQLAAAFEAARDQITEDVSSYFDDGGPIDPNSTDDALLTVQIELEDGGIQWPGEIEAVREGVREVYKHKAASTSAGEANTGVTECSICGEEKDVYGARVDLDKIYTLKKQGRFPEHNASNAWRNRPFCIDCITAINTAWDRFVEAQQYGIPDPGSEGILRCRVFPYALPVEGGQERLATLIKNRHDDLCGGGEERLERPLQQAWDWYLDEVELGVEDDVLRLAFMHYVHVPSATRSYGLSWIDGVSQPQVSEIEATVREILATPLFEAGLLPGIAEDGEPWIAPTEREVFTGRWLYEILAQGQTESAQSTEAQWPDAIDDRQWVTVTQQLLTREPVSPDTLHSHVAAEIRARTDPEEESDIDDGYYSPPFDEAHVAQVYTLLQTINQLGLVPDQSSTGTPTMETFDTEYETLGAAIEAFLDDHESIATSPGRKAAFTLGIVASRLSRWQQNRGLNQTFLQTHETETLRPDDLSTWQTQIWEKAKTYNSQAGNYGIPWRDVHELFSEAILAGEQDGWQASNDDIQTYFVMGATLGPRFDAVVTDEEAEETSSTPEATNGS